VKRKGVGGERWKGRGERGEGEEVCEGYIVWNREEGDEGDAEELEECAWEEERGGEEGGWKEGEIGGGGWGIIVRWTLGSGGSGWRWG